MAGLIQGHHQNPNLFQKFKEAFNVISECTTMAIKNSKPEDLAEGETHITEYVDNFHLVPVGAFALDCMRNDELVLDALFIFNQCKETFYWGVNLINFSERSVKFRGFGVVSACY